MSSIFTKRVTSRSKIRAAIAMAAAAGMVTMLPVSASAEESTIAGYTETSFVAAAVEQGVDAAVAESAWGDRDAMAAIPVSSTSFPGVQGREASSDALTARAAIRASGTCFKSWNNFFGFEIVRVTLDKQWSYSGATISSPAVQFYGSAGTPYTYDGLVGSNDFYSYAYQNPKGTHTSYRQGKFSEFATGTSLNASVTLKSLLSGGYSCTYGGGL